MDKRVTVLKEFYQVYTNQDRNFKAGEMVIGQDYYSEGHDLFIILSGPVNDEYRAACLSRGVTSFGELPAWRIIGRYDVEKTT